MKKPINLFKTLIIFSIVIFVSCASTELTNVHKAKEYTGGVLKNVMIVGVANTPQEREMFEEHFAESFISRGVEAVASFAVLPKDEELKKDMIKNKAEELGIGAIFVTHLIGVEEKEIYYSPADTASPPSYYDNFGHYYNNAFWYHRYAGYYTTHEAVKLESNLYETQTEDLIWTAASETLDPKDAKQVIESLSKKVMKNLRKNGLLAK
ncbi:hypothetical protein ACFL9U_00625 [Thermodesulfobacteriota bacterium]